MHILIDEATIAEAVTEYVTKRGFVLTSDVELTYDQHEGGDPEFFAEVDVRDSTSREGMTSEEIG